VRILDGGGQGRHRRIAADQRVGHCPDAGRRRERFIALQVHHHGVVRPTGNTRALGQAVGAGRVRRRGHRHLHFGQPGQRVGNALIVGGDPDLASARLQRAARHVQDQRLTAQQAQWLARQPRCGVAGRDGDDEFGHAGGTRQARCNRNAAGDG